MKLILFLIILIFNILNINCENLLKVSDVKLAQTHVIPIGGKSWNLKNKNQHMSIVGNRRALLLASFEDQNQYYFASVWLDDRNIGSIELNDPSQLPPTEDNGVKYSKKHHSNMLPKEWIKVGMKIQFACITIGDNETINTQTSDFFYPDVGQDYTLKMWTLPFYLFGANDTNTQPFSKVKGIDSEITKELIEKWSCSELQNTNHPIKRIDWPYFVVEPRNGYPAIVMKNSDQKRDGFEIMNGALKVLTEIRREFGEASTSIQIYSPLLHLNSKGKYADTNGGLGGGSRGTGDSSYKGIFIHEQGHAMGLPHAGEAYNDSSFPYVKGSLLGSEWGYDANHNEFLGTFIPPTAENYENCKSSSVLDSEGRCVKQSVMQSGAGDQSSKYRFSMFADFEMTTIQDYFKNAIYYNNETNVYQKWNDTSKIYYNYKPVTQKNGIWGIDDGAPIERDIDVYTILFTYSTVGPKELSQFYPILKSKGNLIRHFDPTNKTEMETIIPNISPIPWYCHDSGCDYTIRVTFNDGSKQHILLQRGKRQYWSPTTGFKTGINDPKSSDSFMLSGVNIKATKTIKTVELLETLLGWNGIQSNATVLVSKSF
ncbi:hypothetical protein RB653_003802 [Dictyostelium firmibasis]|uniref:Peptidase M66 domain-containing protein n=1 Tax=Dictyostelium firmibasis TaxID=79012 RepID=A0AAN7TYD3_9MYCE